MNGTIARRTRRTSTAVRLAAIAAAIAALSGLGPDPAAAQFVDGRSVLTLLPVAGSVSVGDEVTGRLAADDYVTESRRVKAYEFEGGAGDPVTIDLVSDDFDAYLYLIGPDGNEVDSDDDSGGQCHARISTFLDQTGTYRIVAASFSGAQGGFTLRVADRQSPAASGGCGGTGIDPERLEQILALEPAGTLSLSGQAEATGELGAGDTRLGDGTPVEAWLVTGEPGQSVVVDLMSRAFDTVLLVVEPGGDDYMADDDSGGACNSRMEITLGAEPHRIVASAWQAEGGGPYTIRLSATAGPPSTDACPGGQGPDWIR